MVDTYGTGRLSDERIAEIVSLEFDLRPKGIVVMLDLLKPRYKKSASYGHFGRENDLFTWEKTDKVEALKKYLV
jgi:S-adenosylmethionine synthetase